MGRHKYREPTLPANSIFRILQSFPSVCVGPLEKQLLSVLWRRGSATVQEVIDYGDLQRAYTTVMTTLDRMYRKHLVDRVVALRSRAFRYTPRLTQAEWERAAATETVAQVLRLGTSAACPLSYLVEAIVEHDARLLDDLRGLVDEARRRETEKSSKTKQQSLRVSTDCHQAGRARAGPC
ncbi:MAG TPA: BlaI/MecI/CopY family transcriptional regulator [Terriglobales bacterium]|nr:BlaI/MecI/CopY family transcriptional regulator [Terriglobales bacterium]